MTYTASAACPAQGEFWRHVLVHLLDCCIQWPAGGGGDKCLCMANDRIGMPSCEAAAQAAGGTVVDICPQYQPRDHGTCWPPWDINCQR